MAYQKDCSGCEVLNIEDPRERAHRLVDLHIDSGGYDHYGPLVEALRQAASDVLHGVAMRSSAKGASEK